MFSCLNNLGKNFSCLFPNTTSYNILIYINIFFLQNHKQIVGSIIWCGYDYQNNHVKTVHQTPTSRKALNVKKELLLFWKKLPLQALVPYLCILVRLTHLNANVKEGEFYLELEKYKSASTKTTPTTTQNNINKK